MNSVPLSQVGIPILCAVVTFLNAIFLLFTFLQNKDKNSHTYHNPHELLLYFGVSSTVFFYILFQAIINILGVGRDVVIFHRLQLIFLGACAVVYLYLPEAVFKRKNEMKIPNLIVSMILIAFIPFAFTDYYISADSELHMGALQGKENIMSLIHMGLMLLTLFYAEWRFLRYAVLYATDGKNRAISHKLRPLLPNHRMIILVTTIIIISGIIEFMCIIGVIPLKISYFFGISVGMTVANLLITILLMREYSQVLRDLDAQRAAIDRENHKIEEEYKDLLATINGIQERDDEYTGGHSQRVAEIAEMLAEALKLEERLIKRIKTSAIIHDIGKVGVKKTILNKPGKLTPEEFEHVSRHSALGYDIISLYQPFEEIAYYVRYHHEKLNGTGYPDKITAKDIPYVDRILSIADIFDALYTKRPYRDALPVEKCISIMYYMSLNGEIDMNILRTLEAIIRTGKIK